MAEIMSMLFFDTMNYYASDLRNNANDRIVLSKGHAAPILNAAWAKAGLFPVEDSTNLRPIVAVQLLTSCPIVDRLTN
jgi:transketolase